MFLFCSWKRISGIYSKVLNRTYSTGGMKGRLTGVSVGNVLVASYSYDAVGRIAGINNISFGYLANSNLLSTAARPNNVNTVWNYEADRDLVTSVENKLNSAVISKYAYTNDAIGRRTAMARSGSVFSASDTLSYLYNDRSEVTGANSNAADSLYHYAYSFDNIGNRLTANLAGTPWTYTANNLNQYTAFTKNQVAETPSYDDDGNMLTRDGWVQTWNAENRLIKAEKGTTKLEFAYDYMGRRIFKKVYSSGTLTSYTRFVYDGYKLMEELDALNNNAVLRRYAWSTVGLDVPVSVYDAVANAMYYYHTDANKNITELTNASGSIVAHYEYSPFGKVIVSTGSYAGTNPFRFSSEYHDDETGLVYYNYRYYSPELGRWLSRDPIGEQGGVNLYIIVQNNLIFYCDINGLNFSMIDALRKVKKQVTQKIDNLKQEVIQGIKEKLKWIQNEVYKDIFLIEIQVELTTIYVKAEIIDYYEKILDFLIDQEGDICGSSKLQRLFIPDYPFGFDFGSCCDEHDKCYDGRGKNLFKDRIQCDDEFYECMNQKVDEQSRWYRPSSVGKMFSKIYYDAVSKHGEKAFEKARKKLQ